jgi:ankyrin repeat protein
VTHAQTGDLVAAAKRGDLAAVNNLLRAGADVNERKLASFGPGGIGEGTALMAASSSGHLDVIKALLAAKADVNVTLSDKKDGETALTLAARQSQVDVVRALLAAKANIDAGSSSNALYDAAVRGDIDIVRVLLTAKPDVNIARPISDRTPLSVAIGAGRFELARLLIDAGANVNRWDKRGLTPLLSIASGDSPKNLEMMQVLLAAHADPNFRECNKSFSTALGIVSARGNADAAQALLGAGADANLRQCDGKTPLMLASLNGHTDIVGLLLAAKADVNAKQEDGSTALSLALQNNHEDVAELLRNATQ